MATIALGKTAIVNDKGNVVPVENLYDPVILRDIVRRSYSTMMFYADKRGKTRREIEMEHYWRKFYRASSGRLKELEGSNPDLGLGDQ